MGENYGGCGNLAWSDPDHRLTGTSYFLSGGIALDRKRCQFRFLCFGRANEKSPNSFRNWAVILNPAASYSSHTVTVWFWLSVEVLASRVRVKSPHTKLGFRFIWYSS